MKLDRSTYLQVIGRQASSLSLALMDNDSLSSMQDQVFANFLHRRYTSRLGATGRARAGDAEHEDLTTELSLNQRNAYHLPEGLKRLYRPSLLIDCNPHDFVAPRAVQKWSYSTSLK